MIPFGKQTISEDDIQAVVKALKSNWLTTGPSVENFEKEFAKKVGSKYAVAVSNGTAALYVAYKAIGLKEGDELITTPMTFSGTSNSALQCDAKIIFADIDENGLIDPEEIEKSISPETKAIVPVHYTGLVPDMKRIFEIAQKNKIFVIEDACHALGTHYRGSNIGSCKYSDIALFSFHPTKHITTAEGGMITTNSEEIYEKLKTFRNHGFVNGKIEDFIGYYSMEELSFNFRLSDIQCALGNSQLSKLDQFVESRRNIAKTYDNAFKDNSNIDFLKEKQETNSSYHLYVIKTKDDKTRNALFKFLRDNDIFCQIHYVPVYYLNYYKQLGFKKGLCKNAESFYERIISIPIFPNLTTEDQNKVIKTIEEFFEQ